VVGGKEKRGWFTGYCCHCYCRLLHLVFVFVVVIVVFRTVQGRIPGMTSWLVYSAGEEEEEEEVARMNRWTKAHLKSSLVWFRFLRARKIDLIEYFQRL
jgi:hypothetical protein